MRSGSGSGTIHRSSNTTSPSYLPKTARLQRYGKQEPKAYWRNGRTPSSGRQKEQKSQGEHPRCTRSTVSRQCEVSDLGLKRVSFPTPRPQLVRFAIRGHSVAIKLRPRPSQLQNRLPSAGDS